VQFHVAQTLVAEFQFVHWKLSQYSSLVAAPALLAVQFQNEQTFPLHWVQFMTPLQYLSLVSATVPFSHLVQFHPLHSVPENPPVQFQPPAQKWSVSVAVAFVQAVQFQNEHIEPLNCVQFHIPVQIVAMSSDAPPAGFSVYPVQFHEVQEAFPQVVQFHPAEQYRSFRLSAESLHAVQLYCAHTFPFFCVQFQIPEQYLPL